MRAWLDVREPESWDAVYVERGVPGRLVMVTRAHVGQVGYVPASAVELVTAASVVDAVRAELLAIPGMTPAARRAVRDVLERVAGVER